MSLKYIICMYGNIMKPFSTINYTNKNIFFKVWGNAERLFGNNSSSYNLLLAKSQLLYQKSYFHNLISQHPQKAPMTIPISEMRSRDMEILTHSPRVTCLDYSPFTSKSLL
jgi:hypothetical protein